jgi:uncharacterized surface protein with fasciclin (FAS1) repeats
MTDEPKGRVHRHLVTLRKAGLVGALQAKGPYTVFAPTDAAFAKVPKATLAALAFKPGEFTCGVAINAISDANLSPRTRKHLKLARIVRLAFKKTGMPPATSSEFYKVGKVMGKGAFGKVNLAIHRMSKEFVALKILKNKKRLYKQGLVEAKLVECLNKADPEDKKNIIRKFEQFVFRKHLMITFEMLSINLYEFIKMNNF